MLRSTHAVLAGAICVAIFALTPVAANAAQGTVLTGTWTLGKVEHDCSGILDSFSCIHEATTRWNGEGDKPLCVETLAGTQTGTGTSCLAEAAIYTSGWGRRGACLTEADAVDGYKVAVTSQLLGNTWYVPVNVVNQNGTGHVVGRASYPTETVQVDGWWTGGCSDGAFNSWHGTFKVVL
jgi:hypothetical protein